MKPVFKILLVALVAGMFTSGCMLVTMPIMTFEAWRNAGKKPCPPPNQHRLCRQ